MTRAAVALLLLAFATTATAREVSVPMRLDNAFIRRALLSQVYTDPNQTAVLWDDGSGCNYFVLSDPQVNSGAGRIRIVSAGEARIGTALGSTCISPVSWKGYVEVFEEPVLDPQAAVVSFRVVDSNIYGRDWKKGFATGTLWDWVKRYVHPRLETVRFDLHQAAADLRGMLGAVISSADVARIQQLTDTLRLSSVEVTDDGVAATMQFEIAEAATPAAAVSPAPEPTLTAEELERWDTALRQWDAFLTFVIKHAGGDTGLEALRQQLFDVLVEGRYDLLEALAPSAPGGPDPMPPLFLKTWERLAPVLRQLSTGLPGEQALQYLSLVAAGDALEALDQLGPEIGVEISADGLRRLARIIAPAETADPLAFDYAVDPELRRIFGFGPPLPVSEDNPDVDLSHWWSPGIAWAAKEAPNEFARLNHWVPSLDEIDTYLPLVRSLLLQTAAKTMNGAELDDKFEPIYRWLVLATAWQESCWRQFIKVGNRIQPIKSAVGSVGLMQVNQRVWRGFYDVKSLQQDITYNARAGSEILMHYFKDYAIARGEHSKTGNLDNLARATYAAYNGGPGQLQRYRRSKTRRMLRLIDESFLEKYRKVKAGKELAVAECYGR